MARPPRRHPDPLVRDLQTIRQLSWSRPDGFAGLERLLEHRLVLDRAVSDDLASRLAALRGVLLEAVARLRRNDPDGALTAKAATALLRLDSTYEEKTADDIRKETRRAGRGGADAGRADPSPRKAFGGTSRTDASSSRSPGS